MKLNSIWFLTPCIPVAKPVTRTVKKSYQSSKISTETQNNMINHLKTVMSNSQCYLEPEISLKQLAQQSDISIHDLSQILSQGVNTRFYDFINAYRVEDAIKMLNKGYQKPMVDLALEVGFKSRTTFYKAFNKKVGKTPLQYKREMLN